MRYTLSSFMLALLILPSLSCVALADETAGQYIDDATITSKAKTAFIGDSELKSSNISVSTYHGIVVLTGSVARSDQKTTAENDASQIKGVKAVKDQLVVSNASDTMNN